MFFSILAYFFVVKPYREGKIKNEFLILLPIIPLATLVILDNLNVFNSRVLHYAALEEVLLYIGFIVIYLKGRHEDRLKENIESPGKRIAGRIVDLLYSEILIKYEDYKLASVYKDCKPTMILPTNQDLEWEIEKANRENLDYTFEWTDPNNGKKIIHRKSDYYNLYSIQQELYTRIIEDPELNEEVKKEAFIRFKKGIQD